MRYRRLNFTQAEFAIIDAEYATTPLTELAARLGTSVATLRQTAYVRGIQRPKAKRGPSPGPTRKPKGRKVHGRTIETIALSDGATLRRVRVA